RDLTNIPLNAPAGTCGDRSPAINETIDDVLILAVVEEIDGPRGTLAQAGPCYIRTAGQLPILGLMRFDAADLADIESVGALSDVILHEMGHVLGFGTVWHLQGLLAEPAQDGGPDPHFTGNQAIAAFDAVGGTDYTGNKVPVEDQGGPATADSHWRESVMGNELMTGFVSLNQPANNPLSLVTVASMADQGYLVNSSAADSYSLIVGLRAGPIGPRLQLGDDRLRVPFRLVDSAGRVVRIVRP
ncbi:MAG: leishmanolysin-related zinc metalloendopeptidase, partial [bacterium]